MNKCLKAQISAAFIADIAFGANRAKREIAPPPNRRQATKRITGTLSLRH